MLTVFHLSGTIHIRFLFLAQIAPFPPFRPSRSIRRWWCSDCCLQVVPLVPVLLRPKVTVQFSLVTDRTLINVVRYRVVKRLSVVVPLRWRLVYEILPRLVSSATMLSRMILATMLVPGGCLPSSSTTQANDEYDQDDGKAEKKS